MEGCTKEEEVDVEEGSSGIGGRWRERRWGGGERRSP